MSTSRQATSANERSCAGRLESCVKGFAEQLMRQGYAPNTIHAKCDLLADLGHWIDRRRLSLAALVPSQASPTRQGTSRRPSHSATAFAVSARAWPRRAGYGCPSRQNDCHVWRRSSYLRGREARHHCVFACCPCSGWLAPVSWARWSIKSPLQGSPSAAEAIAFGAAGESPHGQLAPGHQPRRSAEPADGQSWPDYGGRKIQLRLCD